MSFIFKLIGILKMPQRSSIDDSYAHGIFAAGNFSITLYLVFGKLSFANKIF